MLTTQLLVTGTAQDYDAVQRFGLLSFTISKFGGGSAKWRIGVRKTKAE
jgi:hypothetical protein